MPKKSSMLFSSWSCRGGDSGKLESISLGIWPDGINTLIYLAQDQNYFADERLNVTIKDYTSVADALNGMLSGESNIPTASEFVLVGKALQGEGVFSTGSWASEHPELVRGSLNSIVQAES